MLFRLAAIRGGFKFGFIGLTEQSRIGKGDPHPSRPLGAPPSPRGRQEIRCVSRSLLTKNTLIYISFRITKNIKPLPSPRGKVPTSSCGGRRMRVDRVTASSVRQQTYKLQFHFAQTVPCNKKTTSFQRSFLLLCFFVAPSVSRVLWALRREPDDHLSARLVTKTLHGFRRAPPSKWSGSGRPALRPYTVLHRIEFTANPRYRGSG